MWWESVIIAALTLFAAAFLVRTFWKTVGSSGGCGCGKQACGALKNLDAPASGAKSGSCAPASPQNSAAVGAFAEASDAT